MRKHGKMNESKTLLFQLKHSYATLYFMQNKDDKGMLEDEAFYIFLSKITAFIWTFAITNPGVNALRRPVYAEMVNIVNGISVTFPDDVFDLKTVRNIFDNFSFYNGRPITKAMLAWWAFQDDQQKLLPIETVLEIEHIYARNRQDKERPLSDVRSLELLGNKSLLEKRINIRASDYRFADKAKYYLGFINGRGQVKEGTRIYELSAMAKTRSDYTEGDILQRNDNIFSAFLEFVRDNGLGQ